MLTSIQKMIVWCALLGSLTIVIGFELDDAARYKTNREAAYHQTTLDKKLDNVVVVEKADDRIAKYTRWLAILTGGLVLANIIQFFFLYRADQTARISAETARKSAEHIPKVERAYLSGGGTGRVFGPEGSDNPAALFEFQVNNFGKTPGELREIRYGFLPMPTYENDFRAPEPPPYSEKLFWQDWYRPGIQSRSIPKHALITIGVPSVIFGRLYYRDIFGAWHSSGFVLQLDHRAGSSPIKALPSYTDKRDEPDYKP